MGRRSTGTVEPLKTAIRLKFTWLGARCVETLGLAPTPANIKAAERLMDRIQGAIASGSTAAPTTSKAPALAAWTDVRGLCRRVAEDPDRREVHPALLPYRHRRDVAPGVRRRRRSVEVRYSDIKKAVAAKAAVVSGKTINNALIPLRAIFDMALKDGLIAKDPTEGIENLKHQAAEPTRSIARMGSDPGAYAEAKYPEPVWNYYAFAFNTGLRPSEQIVLSLARHRLAAAEGHGQRARVDWEEKGTKTNRIREVDLSDAPWPACSARRPTPS
jgi:integrase